jgi:hypothetical protein
MAQLNPEILNIPADAADLAAQRQVGRSALVLFFLLNGALAAAAAPLLWPFAQLNTLQLKILLVVAAIFVVFVAVLVWQWTPVAKNLLRRMTVCYMGRVTSRRDEDGEYFISMGEREFSISPQLYANLRPGHFLAVREWTRKGGYIEHTGDLRRIDALRSRAIHP